MSLKNEIAALESATFQTEVFLSSSRRLNEDDYHKMEEHVKKMSLQLDLTKQRCANYEAKIKTLEGLLAFQVHSLACYDCFESR
jgi:uridine kinase